jgi:protein-tyrosine phosphatase
MPRSSVGAPPHGTRSMGKPVKKAGPPFRVLVVCIGNVCRSPLTEGLLVRAANEHGLRIATESAGTKAMSGWEMDPITQAQLQERQIDPSGFRARQLLPEHLEKADLVLTANRSVRGSALQLHPQAVRRTFTITEAAALASPTIVRGTGTLQQWVEEAVRHRPDVAGVELDIPDPRGQRRKVHKRVAQTIEQAVTNLAAGWSQWVTELDVAPAPAAAPGQQGEAQAAG